MYVLPHYSLLRLTPLLFFGAGAFVASAPTAAESSYNGTQPTPTPAPISSLIAPTGNVANLRSATPASSFGSAASPSRIGTVDPSLLGGVPSGLRSLIVGASSQSTSCDPFFSIGAFPSMDVYYWPSGSSNTACLSTITDQLPAPPQPTGMISPYVYVVYPPVSTYDGCGNLLSRPNYSSNYTTQAYLPEDMHTLQDIPGASPATQVFNFNDLPCPPPAIADELDPGSAYRPVVIANETSFVEQDDEMYPSERQFFRLSYAVADPARPIVRVNAISGPGQGVPP